ncbi:protein of unknown function [Mesotoga infera]|uniref:Uncharacterized protein n=1 Tax=Mesotoga infera TaxID=1236046 RepID=A0A7Z7LEB9_9BACT|nr:protein of unknown function [Mesotoga infera]
MQDGALIYTLAFLRYYPLLLTVASSAGHGVARKREKTQIMRNRTIQLL